MDSVQQVQISCHWQSEPSANTMVKFVFLFFVMHEYGLEIVCISLVKVCARAKWPIKPELIPVSVA